MWSLKHTGAAVPARDQQLSLLCERSFLPSRTLCYASAIQETCNTSAADINVLKTVIYNAKLSGYVSTSCELGKLKTVLSRSSDWENSKTVGGVAAAQ